MSIIEGRYVLNTKLFQTLVYNLSVLTWGFERLIFLKSPFSFYVSELTFLRSTLAAYLELCIVHKMLLWNCSFENQLIGNKKSQIQQSFGLCYFFGLSNNTFASIKMVNCCHSKANYIKKKLLLYPKNPWLMYGPMMKGGIQRGSSVTTVLWRSNEIVLTILLPNQLFAVFNVTHLKVWKKKNTEKIGDVIYKIDSSILLTFFSQ